MINLKSVLKTTLPDGNNLTAESNLIPGNLTTLGNQFTNDSANALAEFESSFDGGAISQFSENATAELGNLTKNLQETADNTITAVTGDINNLKTNLVNEANSFINANNEVVANNLTSVVDANDGFGLTTEQQEVVNSGGEIVMDEVVARGARTGTNPLERFVSANYIITMGCLTDKELADPDSTYMKNGAQHIIFKSGGGSRSTGTKKATTAMEDSLGGRTEYFIEDLEISSVISPNGDTRTAHYHKLTFRVVEPYSMGQFLETLEVASRKAGHYGYQDSPFLMSIDWVGYLQEPGPSGDFTDSNRVTRLSQMEGQSPRHIPFKFINAGMQVTTRGTEYECRAIIYNGQAWSDMVQKIPIDIAISGTTVEEVLQSGAQSLTTVLNTNLLKREEDDERVFADEYVIIFPTKLASENSPAKGEELNSAITPAGLSTDEARDRFNSGKISAEQLAEIEKVKEQFDFEAWAQKILGISLKRNKVSEAFKADAVEQSNINSIGKSKIVFDNLQDGDQPAPPMGFVYDPKNQTNVQAALPISKDVRELKFKKESKVSNIIEEVILASKYGRGLMDQAVGEDGTKEWFRIEGQVFNIPVPESEVKKGRKPKLWVFRVVPYRVNVSLIEKPTEPAIGIESIKSKCVKYYEYMYTGKNKDIIDLDLKFDTRFLSFQTPDKGSNQKSVKVFGDHATEDKAKGNTETQKTKEGDLASVNGLIRKVGSVELVRFNDGMRAVPGNEKEEIARTFHQAMINHTVDLFRLDLKIWGDPYYIADSGMGNFNTGLVPGDPKAKIDSRGQMTYQHHEVFIHLTFRTPLDIGDDGVMKFNVAQNNEAKASSELEKFSGVYKVWKVESSFSQGRFEQTLRMLRYPNNQPAQLARAKKGNTTSTAGTSLEPAKVKKDPTKPPQLGGST